MSSQEFNPNIPKLPINSVDETELKNFESKVDNVMQILEQMNSMDKDEQIEGLKKADKFVGYDKNLENIDEDSFIVTVRDDRTVINTKGINSEGETNPDNLDKFTFMQQMETDANKRSENRRERENIAQNFRQLGNQAFRTEEYEKAISLYTKGIDHINNSPILYNNRALSYIKLKVYKRAIIDCDFVINKLDEKNLRSWLYRAAAYLKLNDEQNYETSIKMAKKNNSKEIDYIEKFLHKLKTEDF